MFSLIQCLKRVKKKKIRRELITFGEPALSKNKTVPVHITD